MRDDGLEYYMRLALLNFVAAFLANGRILIKFTANIHLLLADATDPVKEPHVSSTTSNLVSPYNANDGNKC